MDCTPLADVQQPKSTLHHHHDDVTTTTTTSAPLEHSIHVDSSEEHQPKGDGAVVPTKTTTTTLGQEQAVASHDETLAASLAVAWSRGDDDDQAKARARSDCASTAGLHHKQPGAVSVSAAAGSLGKNDSLLYSKSADQSLNDQSGLSHSENTLGGYVAALPGGLDDPDLEYGEYGGLSDQSNMAVAVTVMDDADCFLPSALELDPDAKPSLATSARSDCAGPYRMVYMGMVLLLLAAAAVGVGLVVSRSPSSSSSVPAALDERETVGIRESIVHLLGHSGAQVLDDPTHAYSKALDWIQNDDPLALTPKSPQFIQRYLLAYMYYSTSARGPWNAGCDPELLLPTNDTNHSNDCTHVYTYAENADIVERVSAKRWLSGETECQWGGIACDGLGQVEELQFSTCICIE
jgi:hypothetical protein